MSMLIEDKDDPLAPGDSIDIKKTNEGTWAKRLTASQWSMDRSQMLWDGIWYDGQAHGTGTYSWRRDGGGWHTEPLAADTAAPVISDLMISPGGEMGVPDTLSFRFNDADTHAGWIRALASADFPGQPEVWILRDKFFRATLPADAPITETFDSAYDGLWTLTLQVWDVGDGHETRVDSTYWHVTNSVEDQRTVVPELSLSRGRPNPSGKWMAWDLQLAEASQVDLRVIGVDGRCIRAWPGKALPGGVTRILWDGVDDHGVRVASGRYYLAVTDEAGQARSTPVTIVR
jgi:hypothetical protein